MDALRNLAVSLAKKARMKEGNEQVRLYEKTAELYEKALHLVDPKSSHEILFDWGNSLYRRGISLISSIQNTKLQNSDEIDISAPIADSQMTDDVFAILKLSSEKYEEALQCNPTFTEALINWGMVMECLSLLKRSPLLDRLFEDCANKYFLAFKKALSGNFLPLFRSFSLV